MGVIFESGFVPAVDVISHLLQESGDFLLLETGDKIILSETAGDQPLTHARIAHSNNWYSSGSITASSTANGFFASGPNNSLTYEKWKPSVATATWEIDIGSVSTVDYCAIAAHNMGTSGNTLQVQYFNGSIWVNAIPATAINDNMPIFCIFSKQDAQRWRISISGGAAPEIGVIRFGAAMQMPQAIYGGHSPLDYGRMTRSRSAYSMSGEFLGRSKQRGWLETSFDWTHLTRAWIDTHWKSFQKAAESEPFFIAWRPSDFSEVGYCQTERVPAPTSMSIRSYHSVNVAVTARAYD